MKKSYLLIILLSACLCSSAQDWVKYSDSILANIRNNNNPKASEFLKLAEKDLSKGSIKRDTMYADFLYRRGLLNYFQNKNPEVDFNESLNIWNESKKKNPKKLLRLYYFFGNYYDLITQNYNEAYKQYELCYNVGRLIDFDSNDAFKSITYRLSAIDYFIHKNKKNAKKWAIEYIELKKDKAYEDFDFDFVRIHQYKDDIETSKNILLLYLSNYKEWNKDEPIILFNIYYNLLFLFNDNTSKEIEYAEKSLEIIITYNLDLNKYKKDLIEYLMEAYFRGKDLENSKKYAKSYIELYRDTADDEFNLKYADAFKYLEENGERERILLKYLENYRSKGVNNADLLFQIYIEIASCSLDLEKHNEAIKFALLALSLKEDVSINTESEEKLLFTLLILAYNTIGDNINENKFIKLKSLYYPENDNIDYYANLNLLLINEDYEKFESLFKDYEDQLIKDKKFNSLIEIYFQSLTLFEQGIIFKKVDIEKQKSLIEENLNSLSDENKTYFDFFIAEYSLFIQDFVRVLQIANNYLDFKEDTFRLGMYRFKAISEMTLGIEHAKETAYKALEIATELYGDKDPQLLAYLNLILTVNTNGDDNQTTKIATQALEIIYSNGLENTDLAAQVWSQLGKEAYLKGNYIDGELYNNKSINIYENYDKISNVYSYYSSLLGLSAIYTRLSKFDKSLKYIKKTKTILDNNPNIIELAYGDYYYYLGDYYFWQDKFQEAKESYEMALDIYGASASKGRDLHLILCHYFLTNNVDATIKRLEKYYNLNGDIGTVQKIIYLLKCNANQFDEARNILISSLNKIINDNNEYFHLLSDDEREVVYRNFTEQFEFLNSHLLFTKDESFLEKYINYRLYLKSLLFYNNSTNIVQNEESRSNLNQLKANNILINKYYEKQDGNNYLNEINKLKQNNRELEKFLSQSKGIVDNPTIKRIKNELTTENAYVEIIRINKQSRSATKDKLNILNKFTDSIYYGAVIIKKDKAPKFILISESTELEKENLLNYNNFISGNNKFKVDKNSYTLLFESLDKELTDLESIYLVTDGIYNSINPETFYNPNKDKYVLEYLNVHRIISARSLLNKPVENSNENLTATLIGNPEFELIETSNKTEKNNLLASAEVSFLRDYTNTKQISYLPGTEKEINSLENILNEVGYKVDLFSSNKATEENLKSIQSPKILHLATHGYFLRVEEETNFKNSLMDLQSSYLKSNVYLKSGLLLTGAQNTLNGNRSTIESDNGIFTAFEAKQLDLKKTELVVLSACETGVGDNLIGEGVYGLQRAFMIAGAKSVIMSLWQVDDNTTHKLMQLFYANWLEKKMSKAAAFKMAKIELKKEHPEPFYWAPFIFIE